MSAPIGPRQMLPYALQAGMEWDDCFEKRRFIASGAITKNAIVYVVDDVSSTDTRVRVAVASAAALASHRGSLWIAGHAAASGGEVHCTKRKVVGSLNTNSATAAGHPWWLTTAGSSAAAPTAGHPGVAVGIVLVKSATVGVVEFCPDLAPLIANTPVPIFADPGNAGAIDVRYSGMTELVSAGAETRTLAAPKYPGQQCFLHMDTDGGDIVITAASAINAAGNTIMTFADVRDNITLRGVTVGGALRWEVIANNGVALS